MKPALLLVAFLALTVPPTSARSDLTAVHREKQALPCLGDCVKRSELVASEKRSRFRLRGWRKSSRLVVRLRSALRAQVPLGASGLERAFLCIHAGEGSWSDPAPPFWGGVQMDRSFMLTYGRIFYRAFGPANNWTPSMQLAVAETAYLSGRGFYPWPNTARACGLL